MPNLIDANGLQTATQSELVANQTVALKAIYGNDINLGSSTPDGQWMTINIQSALDLEDFVSQVNASFDPDQAIGVLLDQRCAINGVVRQGGTYTITNVTLVTSQSTNLYGLDQADNPVYTVSDLAGNQWQLITSQVGLAAGTHALAFEAATIGAVLTTPNTITVPVTVVLGVQSINNPTTYTTLGIAQETDAVLRIRRSRSVSISSQGYRKGLYAALRNINGITSVQIEENDTGATSTGSVPPNVPAGIPSHSIWVIISGTPTPDLAPAYSSTVSYAYGDLVSSGGVNYISDQDANVGNPVSDTSWWSLYNPVAQAIYAYRSAGCGMKGSLSYVIIQIDGTPFVVYWDTVSPENLFIKFTAASLDEINAPNYSGILSGLVTSFVPGAGAEVNINGLSTAVQTIDSNTLVTASGFSLTAGGVYTNTLSPTSPAFQFAVAANQIIILPIILAGAAGGLSVVSYVFAADGTVQNTTISVVHGGSTFTFAAIGGYGTFTYAMVSGGGSVNASTGVYTSGIAGTDVVRVTDSLGNTATCTVTVT